MQTLPASVADIDRTGLKLMLNQSRLKERRVCADAAATHLEKLAEHIFHHGFSASEAAELLYEEALKMRNDAQEIY